MQTLVGQTVRFSSRDKKESGLITRQVEIRREVFNPDDSRRYYQVKDVASEEEFFALADKYDEYFLTQRSLIKPQNHREAIQNKSQIDYKK